MYVTFMLIVRLDSIRAHFKVKEMNFKKLLVQIFLDRKYRRDDRKFRAIVKTATGL